MKIFLLVFLCACLYAADAPLYLFYPNAPAHKAVETVPAGNANDTITAIAPADGAIVPLLSERHKAYLDIMPREKRIACYADKDFRKNLSKASSNPLVVDLVWNAKISAAQDAELFISENADLSNAVAITVPANRAKESDDGFRCQLELNNLKVATSYYWKVRIGDAESAVATFSTEERAPRLLRIYGVPNVRELGGYIGLDGRRTRQGMLYRTSGLNNNATKLYTTEEEAKALYPELIQKEAALQEKISQWEKQLGEVENVRILPVAPSHEWTVFLPQSATTEDYKAFCQLTAIPENFLGAASQQLSTDEKWSYTFSKPIEGAPAMFAQTIEADEDGYMVVGCGADWWWMLGVNGKLLCDRLSTKDNVEWPANVDNHVLLVPLRKGTNLIFFAMKSGSGTWTMACGKPTAAPSVADIIQAQLAEDKADLAKVYRIPKGFKPGKDRLTADMKPYLVHDLHIKSDIDLRSRDTECACMTGSPIGPEVTWFSRPSPCYGGMKSDYAKGVFHKVFRLMLIPENYPLIFHCIGGQDRTGSVSAILLGLLGVSEEEIYLDWEVTGYNNPSIDFNHKDRFNQLIAVFDAYPGETLNERIENYVLSCGISKQDIDDFRELMLEE